MNENPGSLGAGLTLDQRLPVRWHVDSPGEPAGLRQANEDTLWVILSLDEHHVEIGEENVELAQEFQRLESKLNLILELMSRVLARQLELPPPTAVRLGAHSLEWESPAPPSPGSRGWLEIYLCARYPQPLCLPAVIESATPPIVRAGFVDPGEVVQDLLETLIFRHHRRQVAAARRGASGV
jgi:hypothetical protein